MHLLRLYALYWWITGVSSNSRNDIKALVRPDPMTTAPAVINVTTKPLLNIFLWHADPHPRQAVPAAELPGSNIGGTGVAVQDDVSGFWVRHEVKLSTHRGVTPRCVNTKPSRLCFVCRDSSKLISMQARRANTQSVFPPMMYRAFSFLGREGSSCIATARLVRGAVATRVT